MKSLFPVLVATGAAMAAPEIVLRPDLPAGEEWYTPPADNPHVKSPDEKWVRKVRRPVLEVYQAAVPNGTAVIVAPGGGFSILAIEHEGREVARWWNARGVTAFVLRYRCGIGSREENQKYAVEDGLLALRTVRQRAGEWRLDPARVGIMGFSAGGYLTIGAATRYDAASRPAFAIPIYGLAPAGYETPADAPPLFIAVAYDDREDFTSTATGLLTNWKRKSRPAELHVFADGGHGFGMNRKGKACDAWTEMLDAWMKRSGLYGR